MQKWRRVAQHLPATDEGYSAERPKQGSCEWPNGCDWHLQSSPQNFNVRRRKELPMAVWKPNQPSTPPALNNEPQRPTMTPSTPVSTFETPRTAAPVAAPQAQEQASIGKSLVIKGEVTGSESLYIDGRVEGSINLPGNRVTVGRNGVVAANISAREIVIIGKVRGNLSASDKVDIRGEGSLSGDVVAQRISIEDGAFFKGGIDIRKPGQKANGEAKEVSVA